MRIVSDIILVGTFFLSFVQGLCVTKNPSALLQNSQKFYLYLMRIQDKVFLRLHFPEKKTGRA